MPWEIDAFESNRNFFLRKYALPSVYVVQFNAESELMNNIQVRRALSQSIDRKRILEKTILRDSTARHGRIVAAPCRHRPATATARWFTCRLTMLIVFARQPLCVQLPKWFSRQRKAKPSPSKPKRKPKKKSPKPKSFQPCDWFWKKTRSSKPVRPEVIKFWKAAGFKVEIVKATDDPKEWDLLCRKMKMIEPVIELWPFLTLKDKARNDELVALPDWLKQELVDLDFTGNFTSAAEHLRILHRHLAAQAFFIPLWEVDDYAVFSASMSGFSDRPVTTYQGISRWSVKPIAKRAR